MQFLRQIEEEGEFSREMNLFLIGDGEAGKTCLINALIDGKAEKIRRDFRTVGIDLKEWQPDGWDCLFHIYDLAGQAVYSKTHQIFLVRRAVYIFVWRALAPLRTDSSSAGQDHKTIFETITYWLHALQNRMPGSYIIMVVTHIDEVESSVLSDQCDKARQHVQKELESIRSAAAPEVPVLRVYNEGESIRVNSLQGDGVTELRRGLKAFVHQMPWFPEPLPKSWIEFRKKLSDLHEKKYIDWKSDYLPLAHSCEVRDNMLKSATKFLHDTGSIRYFVHDYQSGLVYLSTSWMMSVMKGLIRHNRQTLAEYFLLKQDREHLALVSRLELYGRLDHALLPYLWPGMKESEDFWRFSWLPEKKAERERKMWQTSDKMSSDFELKAALALLESFDLICRISDEIIVPGVLPPGKLPGQSVAADTEMCPNRVAFCYEQIPMGAIEAIMVRLIRRNPFKQADFTSYIITLCDEDSIAQVFIADKVDFKENSATVPGTGLTMDGGVLVVRSSSKTWLKEIESDVNEMENNYPGLKRKNRHEHHALSKREAPVFWSPRDDPNFLLSFNDNLAERELSDMRQCPLCLRCSEQNVNLQKEYCNGSFDAGECRVKALNDPDRGHMIMTCRCCIARGGLGLFRLLDIATPDVVILGIENLDLGSKAKIEHLIGQIEIQASVICVAPKLHDWAGSVSLEADNVEFYKDDNLRDIKQIKINADVISFAAQLGAKKMDKDNEMQAKTRDLIKKADFKSSEVCRAAEFGVPDLDPETRNLVRSLIHSFECWELWIDQATVGIVILTDQYIKDPCSKYKFQLAFRAPKYVLPILTTAWSGPRDAAHCSQELGDVIGKSSGLKYFDPIDLQLNTDQDVITTIAQHLKLRIKRTGQSEYFSDFSTLGVKLSFFEKFVDENKLRSPELEDLTTEEVMIKFVKSRTEDTRHSYCEYLKSKGEGRFVGPSDWFYSHAWKFRFLDVVEAAKEFFASQNPDHDPTIWFDVFSVSQHKSAGRSFEWWNSVFLGAVGDIGRVLMIIPPLEHHLPAWYTVRRAWCVFELLACVLNDCELEMVMPKTMRSRLTGVKYTELMESLSQLDCRESVASIPEDRDRIFGLIRRTIGFDQLNDQMKAKAKEWIRLESGAWLAEVMPLGLSLTATTFLTLSFQSKNVSYSAHFVLDLHVLRNLMSLRMCLYAMRSKATSPFSGSVSRGLCLLFLRNAVGVHITSRIFDRIDVLSRKFPFQILHLFNHLSSLPFPMRAD
jgi:GTPase SAR1 family protein